MSYQYFLLFVFAIFAYFIVTDDSVAKFFYYISVIVKQQYEIKKWWFLNNPRNPIVKYLIWRRSLKLTDQIMKELKNK